MDVEEVEVEDDRVVLWVGVLVGCGGVVNMGVGEMDLLSRPGVDEANAADAVEAVFERCEGGALREEHEDAVEAFVEVRVSFWFKELEA